MTEPAPRLRDYIQHIIEAIERISAYTAELDHSGFMRDTKTQDAVMRNLQIIGEAAQNIRPRYPDIIASSPEIPWRSAYGMRNAVVHGYFKVRLDRVWSTIENDLPPFEAQLRFLLDSTG